MAIVVSNTSPLRYLVCIGEEHLWSRLFGKVLIPPAVFRELTHANAPERVRNWMRSLPDSIEVIEVEKKNDGTLNHLDCGEIEAIWLAEQLGADLLLMDDKEGRLTAMARGLKITGTVGLLEFADIHQHLDFATTVQKLLQTNIKVSSSLIDSMLARYYYHRKIK